VFSPDVCCAACLVILLVKSEDFLSFLPPAPQSDTNTLLLMHISVDRRTSPVRPVLRNFPVIVNPAQDNGQIILITRFSVLL
jgi:hypothetical protein